MAEIYGDRDGTARAVSRVLKSQKSWGMIERVEKGKHLVRKAPMTLSDEQVVIWLVEAVIRFTGKAVSLANLQSMPGCTHLCWTNLLHTLSPPAKS